MNKPSAPKSYEQIVNKFRKSYVDTIPEKLNIILQLIDELNDHVNAETLKNLRLQIHKMAGSSGTYGFEQVSSYCKKFENELILKLEELKNSREDRPACRDSFYAYFEEIKKGFSND